jgi:hypothetical protein
MSWDHIDPELGVSIALGSPGVVVISGTLG